MLNRRIHLISRATTALINAVKEQLISQQDKNPVKKVNLLNQKNAFLRHLSIERRQPTSASQTSRSRTSDGHIATPAHEGDPPGGSIGRALPGIHLRQSIRAV